MSTLLFVCRSSNRKILVINGLKLTILQKKLAKSYESEQREANNSVGKTLRIINFIVDFTVWFIIIKIIGSFHNLLIPYFDPDSLYNSFLALFLLIGSLHYKFQFFLL